MDERQIDFAKRLHMLKINTSTMQKNDKKIYHEITKK